MRFELKHSAFVGALVCALVLLARMVVAGARAGTPAGLVLTVLGSVVLGLTAGLLWRVVNTKPGEPL